MAEQVSSLLRRSVEHLSDEVPDSYCLVLKKLGPLVVELDVDGELFSLRGGRRLEVSDGAADTPAPGSPPRELRSLPCSMPRSGLHKPWKRAASPSVAHSTTSSVHTTPCWRTCTPQSVHRRSRNCWPHFGRGHHDRAIATPASCKRRRTVAVLGGGIAGLTAAQELAERGFDVTVYELRADERHGLDDEPGAPTRRQARRPRRLPY